MLLHPLQRDDPARPLPDAAEVFRTFLGLIERPRPAAARPDRAVAGRRKEPAPRKESALRKEPVPRNSPAPARTRLAEAAP